MRIAVTGPPLVLATCARRLGALQIGPAPHLASAAPQGALSFDLDGEGARGTAPLDCAVSWWGPSEGGSDRPGSEAAVQAAAGLMHLHGLEQGRARRLGLEVTSVGAGLLATQGILAALVARCRGDSVTQVQTSVLQAALLEISQYLARASSADEWGDWGRAGGPAPGPPFRTADGHWVELDTQSAEVWQCFWSTLGLDRATLAQGWRCFLPRYSTAAGSMPAGFHEATAQASLVELEALAAASQMSLCRLRGYDEVLAEVGGQLSSAHPRLCPLPPALGRPRPGHRGPPKPGGLPLEGLHVVEATSRIQGPLAGHLLGMLGARVTRVEPPGGDPARMTAPLAGDTGAFFLCMNRGKEPAQLDLGRPAGREGLRELAAQADVFLHNWRPGKACEWGLDSDDLAQVNPMLVYCGASGWGDLTSAGGAMGMDHLVQAHAGLGQATSPAREPPFPSRILLADVAGAMVACEGVLAALLRREQAGAGWRVDGSLWAGAMALQAHALEAMEAGRESGRQNGRPLWGPLDQPVATAEGHLAVSAERDDELARLAQACGASPGGQGRLRLEEAVVRALRRRAAPDWEAALVAAGLPCATVTESLSELTGRPGLAVLFEPLGGTSRVPGTPWRFRP